MYFQRFKRKIKLYEIEHILFLHYITTIAVQIFIFFKRFYNMLWCVLWKVKMLIFWWIITQKEYLCHAYKMDGGKSLTICCGRVKSDFWAVLTAAALGRTAGPASALEPVTEFDPRKEYADLSEPLREQSILLSFIQFQFQICQWVFCRLSDSALQENK